MIVVPREHELELRLNRSTAMLRPRYFMLTHDMPKHLEKRLGERVPLDLHRKARETALENGDMPDHILDAANQLSLRKAE